MLLRKAKDTCSVINLDIEMLALIKSCLIRRPNYKEKTAGQSDSSKISLVSAETKTHMLKSCSSKVIHLTDQKKSISKHFNDLHLECKLILL